MLKVVTLRWTNTAINAGNITIQRKLDNGSFVLLGELDPNVEQYIDIMELDDLPTFESVTYEVNTKAVVAGEERIGEPAEITLTQAELGELDPEPEPEPSNDFRLATIITDASGTSDAQIISRVAGAPRTAYAMVDGNKTYLNSSAATPLLADKEYNIYAELEGALPEELEIILSVNNVHIDSWAAEPTKSYTIGTGVVNSIPTTPPPGNTLYNLFNGATIVDGSALSLWDVSAITNMAGAFVSVENPLTTELNGWDVSNVTDMSFMFSGAGFQGDLSGWNVSSVTAMANMFYRARSFNSDIGGWNVSNVTTMRSMFKEADSFNASISGWDVGNVSDMEDMFYGTLAFNQPLNQWCVTNITEEPSLFGYESALQRANYPVWGTCPSAVS